jgi:hypothetical protein
LLRRFSDSPVEIQPAAQNKVTATDWNIAKARTFLGIHVEGAWNCSPMTLAEEYRQRAIEFFDLAAKSNIPEEREALRTFALCCLQLERAEEDRRQRQANLHSRAMTAPTGAAPMAGWSARAVA